MRANLLEEGVARVLELEQEDVFEFFERLGNLSQLRGLLVLAVRLSLCECDYKAIKMRTKRVRLRHLQWQTLEAAKSCKTHKSANSKPQSKTDRLKAVELDVNGAIYCNSRRKHSRIERSTPRKRKKGTLLFVGPSASSK